MWNFRHIGRDAAKYYKRYTIIYNIVSVLNEYLTWKPYDILSLDVNYFAFLRPVRIVRREKIYNIIPTIRSALIIMHSARDTCGCACESFSNRLPCWTLTLYLLPLTVYYTYETLYLYMDANTLQWHEGRYFVYNYILHVRRIYLRIDNNIIIGVGVRYIMIIYIMRLIQIIIISLPATMIFERRQD